MRILAITDIHSSTRSVRDLLSVVSNIDLIAVAGDISHFGPLESAKHILKILAEAKVPIFFVPGNCDPRELLYWEDPLEKVYNLHGKRRTVQDFVFAGVGGGIVSPFNTLIEYTEEEYLQILNKAVEGLNDFHKLILIVHNPPYDTRLDLARGRTHVGSRSVRAFIEKHQPLLLITGHIHESRGIDKIGRTVMVNPGPLWWRYYALIDVIDEKVDVVLEKI